MDIFSVITLIAGLSFFLFGMKVMSGDLEKLAGGKLEQTLKKFTANPFLSLFLGIVITIAVQSSSAVTVMLVGLVNSGIMQFSQTVFVIFGTNIGTTLTAWILSLSGIEGDSIALQLMKPEYFSPILAFIGIILSMFSKNDRKKSLGTVFVGFAVLMYGMNFMSDAVSPLADEPWFSEILVKFNNPLFGILAGTVVTAVIQSSAASVGILQALALTGAINYGMAIPIVMGQNIGTCITAVLSAIGTNPKAKRVAVVHTAMNVIGTVVFTFIFWLVDKTAAPALFTESASAWGIACVHTVFNLALTLLLAPFAKYLVCLTEKLVPDKAAHDTGAHVFSLDERLLQTPSVAVGECDSYTAHMSENAKEMLLTSFSVLTSYDQQTAEWLNTQESVLDAFEDDIGSYLVKLAATALSEADSACVTKMLYVIGNFERLGDHALNLLESSKEIKDKKLSFSKEAYQELTVLTDALVEIILTVNKAYSQNDPVLAARVEPLEQVIDRLIEYTDKQHIARLKKGDCTIEMGFILSDILANFSRISDHCSNIAVAVIEAQRGSLDTHSYLNGVKYGNEDFDALFSEYAKKYGVK